MLPEVFWELESTHPTMARGGKRCSRKCTRLSTDNVSKELSDQRVGLPETAGNVIRISIKSGEERKRDGKKM